MKKLLLIGLMTLSSTSVFANCDVASTECHLGKYKGRESTAYSNPALGDCSLEIIKSGNKKNDFIIKFTHVQGYGSFSGKETFKPRTLTGKVSSLTQKFEVYDETSRTYPDYISKEFVSHLTLQTNRSERSNGTLIVLDLKFNDQEQLKGLYYEIRTHQPLYSALFSNLNEVLTGNSIDKFDYESWSCENLVKID